MGQPRGIRNNNPGNLRHSTDQWLGEVPGDDKAFKTFSDPAYGIRALAKLLLNYERKYGLRTISGIISRWAPENENDTAAYVDAVARACGVQPFQVIDVAACLPSLVPAIIAHENGQQPYTDEQISQGIAMATGTDHVQTVATAVPNVDSAPAQPAESRMQAGPMHVVAQGPVADQAVGASLPGNGAVTIAGVPVSKKLVVALLGLLAVLLNRPLGLGMSDADTADLVKLLSSYLVGQSAVDAFKPLMLSLLKGAK